MKTTDTIAAGTVSIWAVPLYPYELEEAGEGALPFRYELHTSSQPWTNGSVKVVEHTVALSVPSGIDLLAKAVETLEQAIEDRKTAYHTEVHQIQERIRDLQLLEAPQPEQQSADMV